MRVATPTLSQRPQKPFASLIQDQLELLEIVGDKRGFPMTGRCRFAEKNHEIFMEFSCASAALP